MRRRVGQVPISMCELHHALRVDDEGPRHLHESSAVESALGGLPLQVVPQKWQGHRGAEHLPQLRGPQSEGTVSREIGVDEAFERLLHAFGEFGRIGGGSLTDQDDPGTELVETVVFVAKLHDLSLAEGATEVSEEHHDRRLPLPTTREMRLSLRHVQQGHVGSIVVHARLQDLDGHPECPPR